MINPTDSEILDAMLMRSGSIMPAYYIKNMLRMEASGKWRHLTTPWVLRRLKALEKAGRVVRKRSDYATMICWDVAAPTSQGEGASLEALMREAAVKPPLSDKDPTNIQY